MQMFSIVGMVNLPVFTFPGFACMYAGIGFYNMVTIYFIFPIAMVMYIYLMYRLVLRQLATRYVGRPSFVRNAPPCIALCCTVYVTRSPPFNQVEGRNLR